MRQDRSPSQEPKSLVLMRVNEVSVIERQLGHGRHLSSISSRSEGMPLANSMFSICGVDTEAWGGIMMQRRSRAGAACARQENGSSSLARNSASNETMRCMAGFRHGKQSKNSLSPWRATTPQTCSGDFCDLSRNRGTKRARSPTTDHKVGEDNAIPRHLLHTWVRGRMASPEPTRLKTWNKISGGSLFTGREEFTRSAHSEVERDKSVSTNRG